MRQSNVQERLGIANTSQELDQSVHARSEGFLSGKQPTEGNRLRTLWTYIPVIELMGGAARSSRLLLRRNRALQVVRNNETI